MRPSHVRRAQQPSLDVQEPGKGKALLHVLADGRSTGRYKLSKRQLDEVQRSDQARKDTWLKTDAWVSMYTVRWRTLCYNAQVPEVWQGTSASGGHDGKWWEVVETVALDLSCNNIRSLPVEITNLSESLETLNLWYARPHLPCLKMCHHLLGAGAMLFKAPHHASAIHALTPFSSRYSETAKTCNSVHVLQQQPVTRAARACERPTAAQGIGCEWHGAALHARRDCGSAKSCQAAVPRQCLERPSRPPWAAPAEGSARKSQITSHVLRQS